MSLGLMFADFWLSGLWGLIPPPPGSVVYMLPAGGVDVPPTVQQTAGHSRVSGEATTDGAATTITLTHNLGISAADLARDFPDVDLTSADEDFNALNAFTQTKGANSVVIHVDAGTIASFRFRIERPTTLTR